jgi:LmbE family N-acetylglucosaminyl deacetylase
MTGIEKVLVLAPHTDDGEFGCGGTIARLIASGREVYYVAFSSVDKSLPRTADPDALKAELRQALAVLGIPLDHLVLFDHEVRNFPACRQAILEQMVGLNSETKPNLVLLPSTTDTHQDHQTVSLEGFRAFKHTSILGYELPWNNLTFETTAFAALERHHLESKLNAVSCYRSQAARIYSDPKFLESLARIRGAQVGTQYAEAFQVIRWILR